jgi:hypothetical protein
MEDEEKSLESLVAILYRGELPQGGVDAFWMRWRGADGRRICARIISSFERKFPMEIEVYSLLFSFGAQPQMVCARKKDLVQLGFKAATDRIKGVE